MAVWVERVRRRDCHLLKQQMLALGGDAAVDRRVISEETDESGVVLLGTAAQIGEAVDRLKAQPFRSVRHVAAAVRQAIAANETHEFSVPLRHPGTALELGRRTRIMGVLNVTPDSFSDGGRFLDTEKAIEGGVEMMEQGADIIDIGGESTRPGAAPVSTAAQIQRVVPVIQGLSRRRERRALPEPALISIDTQDAEVAEAALDAGADIVNDVSALREDARMARVVAQHDAPVILMHMQGTPKHMQDDPHYDDVLAEAARFLRERVVAAVEAGISPDRVIVDPGIGFGKKLCHNLAILRCLDQFRSLGRPLLLGTSRKSLIGSILDLPPDRRLLGTAATSALAVASGVHLLRVHDVADTLQVVRVAEAILRPATRP